MDKRAQGLPITTIILAILGLVVLVILFAVLTGRMTIFTGAVNECTGVCYVGSLPRPAIDGALEQPSGELTPAGCMKAKGEETRVYGNFIARGIRDDQGKPIPCSQGCCQRL